jgi:sterol desaturase/sphingolipid hydroxylase (fatty acid hydroxylase superfamily)
VRAWGFAPPRLERLVPWLGDNALASFLVYFVLYDFAAYWVHRAQHRFSWWWALHSLHHSQRRSDGVERRPQSHRRRPAGHAGAGGVSPSSSACSLTTSC